MFSRHFRIKALRTTFSQQQKRGNKKLCDCFRYRCKHWIFMNFNALQKTEVWQIMFQKAQFFKYYRKKTIEKVRQCSTKKYPLASTLTVMSDQKLDEKKRLTLDYRF